MVVYAVGKVACREGCSTTGVVTTRGGGARYAVPLWTPWVDRRGRTVRGCILRSEGNDEEEKPLLYKHVKTMGLALTILGITSTLAFA